MKYELWGIPIPRWLGECLEELMDTTLLQGVTWILVGLLISLIAFLFGLYLSYS